MDERGIATQARRQAARYPQACTAAGTGTRQACQEAALSTPIRSPHAMKAETRKSPATAP